MQYYEFYLSCGFPSARESKYFAFPDSWDKADVAYVFEEKLEEYAVRHSDLAYFPDPADYRYEQDYEEKYDEAYDNWLYEVQIYSSFEECSFEEWEENRGEEVL